VENLFRLSSRTIHTDEETSPGADAAWEKEIGARFDAVKDGTARAISVAEVFTDLDRRYPS